MSAPTSPTGVCPVLPVPFNDDGDLDIDGFAAVTAHVLTTGVRAVMFPGYASEFYKLTDTERTLLTGELLKMTRGHMSVRAVISVADHATAVAVRSAVRAVEAGADMLNVLVPCRVPTGPDAIQAHLHTVLSAVEPTPVVIQHVPGLTGSGLGIDALTQLRETHSNLTAVKVEATPPGPTISALAALAPPLPALVGYAGLHMVDSHARGAVGVQPGASFVELYVRVWELLDAERHTEADALYRRIVPYLSAWMQGVETINAVEKEILRRRGLICSAHCRAPAHHLDAHEHAAITDFLTRFSADLAPDR